MRVEGDSNIEILVVNQTCKYRIYPIMLCGMGLPDLVSYSNSSCEVGVRDDICMISWSTQYTCLLKVESNVNVV